MTDLPDIDFDELDFDNPPKVYIVTRGGKEFQRHVITDVEPALRFLERVKTDALINGEDEIWFRMTRPSDED